MFPIPAPKDLSGESEVTALVLRQKQKNLEVGQKVQYSFEFHSGTHSLPGPSTYVKSPSDCY